MPKSEKWEGKLEPGSWVLAGVGPCFQAREEERYRIRNFGLQVWLRSAAKPGLGLKA